MHGPRPDQRTVAAVPTAGRSIQHGEFELSWPPRHTPTVDGDSGLPFPLA